MLTYPWRRTSKPSTNRDGTRFRPKLEVLENREVPSATSLVQGGSVLAAPVLSNNSLYYAASDPQHGVELWRSAGSLARISHHVWPL